MHAFDEIDSAEVEEICKKEKRDYGTSTVASTVATLLPSMRERGQKRKVALDDDEEQVKVPPVIVERLEEASFASSVVESISSTVVSFCRQLC